MILSQVSHTLLSLVDPEAGQPFSDTQKRLAVFTKMLHSGMPPSSNWLRQSLLPQQATHDPVQDGKKMTGTINFHYLSMQNKANVLFYVVCLIIF
ncbi:hypothetical protein ACSBR1_022482 [Camellia fascicularis]